MEKLYKSIDEIIGYAKYNLGLNYRNEDYIRNAIFSLFNLNTYAVKNDFIVQEERPDRVIQNFVEAALEAKLFTEDEVEYYVDQIMGLVSLLPSQIEDQFYCLYQEDPVIATNWFYDYCIKNDYVKKTRLEGNPRYEFDNLIVTINKSKPEFRDSKKAQLGNSTMGGYPKCSICHENEGFAGRNKKNLRTIDINLNNEKWFWQFSPYGYFNQHGIAVNYEHTPMHVDRDTFKRLLDFVDMFPQWFIGSNAALPRIGGSVLAHDHYQGGMEVLPLMKQKAKYLLGDSKYLDVDIEIVDWPATAIRVVSQKRDSLIAVCEKIRSGWLNYENLSLGIVLKDEEGIHNAISPTVIKTNRGYEMTILLRNNITSKEYPDGVFHAYPQYHIIKKESIGLIEAQGLFILPGRLERELEAIKLLIVGNHELSEKYKAFSLVYNEVKELCGNDYSYLNVDRAMKNELRSICYRILENTAVFKNDKQVIAFLEELGFYIRG